MCPLHWWKELWGLLISYTVNWKEIAFLLKYWGMHKADAVPCHVFPTVIASEYWDKTGCIISRSRLHKWPPITAILNATLEYYFRYTYLKFQYLKYNSLWTCIFNASCIDMISVWIPIWRDYGNQNKCCINMSHFMLLLSLFKFRKFSCLQCWSEKSSGGG